MPQPSNDRLVKLRGRHLMTRDCADRAHVQGPCAAAAALDRRTAEIVDAFAG
jgi:hypothetical protein